MEDSEEAQRTTAKWQACRRTLHPVFALVAGICLLALVGWIGKVNAWVHWCTALTGIVFSLERAFGLWSHRSETLARHRLIIRIVVVALVLSISIVLLFHAPDRWSMASHLFVLLLVLISGLSLMISHQTRFTSRAFHPGLLLITSFFGIIVFGTLLLKMPLCTATGNSCSWLDAAFTSTSAVCVTGLTTQNPAIYFSTTGQVIILLLIQIGGLGIMTLTFFAAVVLFEGLSLHDRLLLGKMIQENRLARVGETLKFIVVMTFISEGIGAAVLFSSLDGIPDLSTRLFHSVFHSISAFCNAGFSTLPDNLASSVVQANWVWQVTIMLLIVIGGLGTIVIEDLSFWAVAKFKRWRLKEGPHRRLRVQTRLVLLVTALLIVIGAGVIFCTEFLFESGPSNGGHILTAFFHSVTARTAGFNTVPMSQISIFTAQALTLLMIIGGSPGGTAGGLRTTVVAVGLAQLWHQLRMGRCGMVFFNRKITEETGSRALGLILLTLIWLLLNFFILELLEAGSGIPQTTMFFELVSAFATVGLSLDLTAKLSDGAKTLLIINMFVGRIGLLTVMATLIKPDKRPASGKPHEDILLT